MLELGIGQGGLEPFGLEEQPRGWLDGIVANHAVEQPLLLGVQAVSVRQLSAVLRRHAVVDAAFAGYPDGRMPYAGRTDSFSPARRADLSAGGGEQPE